MSEILGSIAGKIRFVSLKQEINSSGIRTIECKDKDRNVICELSHKKINESENKYLPILRVYNNNGSCVKTIEIEDLENNDSKVKAIIDKILEIRISTIVDDGLTEAESMCYLMESGDKNREIGYIVKTSDAPNGCITQDLIAKRLKRQEESNYAVGIVTANCHAGSMLLLFDAGNSKIYAFDTESSANGAHREESRQNTEYAEPRGDIFGFNKVESLNFFCKEALQKGNTCELWSSIICLEIKKYNKFEDFISTVNINGKEKKILKGAFIERCSKIVSAITDKGKKYNEIDDTFLNNYSIPESSNSVKLETLRILCEKDNSYKLAQDQQQTTPNIENPIDIFRQHNVRVPSEETSGFPQNSKDDLTKRIKQPKSQSLPAKEIKSLGYWKNKVRKSKSTSDLSKIKQILG